MLIVFSGLPGTGKSAVADAVARVLRLPVLSVDPIESAILQSGITQRFETGLAAYLIAEALADAFLDAGVDPIIDAVNSVEPARDMWRELARKHHTPLRVVVCRATDPIAHTERLARRDRGLALEEPTRVDVERRRAEWADWPEPHLTLDALAGLDANVARTLHFLQRVR